MRLVTEYNVFFYLRRTINRVHSSEGGVFLHFFCVFSFSKGVAEAVLLDYTHNPPKRLNKLLAAHFDPSAFVCNVIKLP